MALNVESRELKLAIAQELLLPDPDDIRYEIVLPDGTRRLATAEERAASRSFLANKLGSGSNPNA